MRSKVDRIMKAFGMEKDQPVYIVATTEDQLTLDKLSEQLHFTESEYNVKMTSYRTTNGVSLPMVKTSAKTDDLLQCLLDYLWLADSIKVEYAPVHSGNANTCLLIRI